MKVLHDILGYKNLKLYQRKDMFNFSLDSVLLADFVIINSRTKNILDIGTNNAVIPLILTTKTTVPITGVEIQKEAVMLAEENVILNQKSDQIQIINADFNIFAKDYKNNKFSTIICNPPFFPVTPEAHLTTKSDFINLARHEITLTLNQLIDNVRQIIANNGSFFMVHRTERFEEITQLLIANHFTLKRVQFIHPFIDKESQSFLVEARFRGKPGLKIEPPIVVHNSDGTYSEVVREKFGGYDGERN